ncbi:response regulator [Taibaiella soli]|uniref:DNA-binding response regulator n=1 Tax=Taibaiella soli TaxID=1649169 RepID=A0A2W2B064_9BACT|nr:response regulator transcription factor [Taibaiella soli]PZF73644.1 DNA-binding response regulator [Taibaiella soli]
MIRIALLDDHPIVISGISKMLEQYEDIIVERTFLTAKDLLHDLDVLEIDVLILDIQMPEMSGDELTQKIAKKQASFKIIVLTNFDSPFYLENMLRFGVNGYLLKSSPEKDIIRAIHAVHAGKQYIGADLEEKLKQVTDFKKRMLKSKLNLTDRENQILQLIADGYTTQEIAGKLFLSYHTIENYRDNILIKLDVKNTAALVKKSVMLGLVR